MKKRQTKQEKRKRLEELCETLELIGRGTYIASILDPKDPQKAPAEVALSEARVKAKRELLQICKLDGKEA